MKTYLIKLAAIVGAGFLTLVALAATGVYACVNSCELVRYQQSKIANAPDVDTLVFGDSSIGFGLDAKAFSELSGKKTLKLALTGYNYGIGAAYLLLREALEQTQPKNVIFAFTPQTFSASIAWLKGLPIQGLVQTGRRRPYRLFNFDRTISWEAMKILSTELLDKQFLMDGIAYVGGTRPTIPDYFSKFDYLQPSERQFDISGAPASSFGAKAPHDYDVFFAKLAALCQSRGLNCLYMHGLLVRPVAEVNRGYIRELGDRIERAGIKVIRESPIEIQDDERGDTINHVAPRFKLAYTQKIYDSLANSLR